MYGGSGRLSTDQTGSALGPLAWDGESPRRPEQRGTRSIVLNNLDQIVDMLSHGCLCLVRLTRDDCVDDVPVLVGEGEMGAGLDGDGIEEGRERIVARVEGGARNRGEHLVV